MASKTRTAWFCKECGYESPKWIGRCYSCGAENSMVEAPTGPKMRGFGITSGPAGTSRPVKIRAVETATEVRFSTGYSEVDRVLGSGAVQGSMILLVGEPGIGKSTLVSGISHRVAETVGPVLYVSGEESIRQIRLRHNRLGALSDNLSVVAETNLEAIIQHANDLKPVLLIVDSIQTTYKDAIDSAPGSVTQIRECAADLMRYAKDTGTCLLITGHVTKSNDIAGPRVLEHMVDVVASMEGERFGPYRILRAVKNRFGATSEVGCFAHTDSGLEEVPDASALFLAERPVGVPGSVVVPSMEGTRPLLVEVQALVSASGYSNPRRTADGVDLKRVQLMVAVLEKRVGLMLGGSDAYVRVAGGLTISEPATDLGLAVALASSFRDRPVQKDIAVFGEVGLAGEVRGVSRAAERIKEAARMGFKRLVVPSAGIRGLTVKGDATLIPVETVAEALEAALE